MKLRGLLQSNHRILIIDDNQSIHDDLRKILLGDVTTQERLQDDESLLFDVGAVPITRFEIDSAYQGREGLEKVVQSLVEDRPYAVAFVDIRMPPGWDGVETIARLWEIDPQLQVVVCTAYSDYSWSNIQRRLGPSDNLLILKKPFDNIEVIQLGHALTRKWLVSSQAHARMEDLDRMVTERTVALEAANSSLQAANARIHRELAEKTVADVAFRTVFESSPIAITLSDLDGRYVDINRAMEELMDMPKANVIGRSAEELRWVISPEEHVAVRAALSDGRGLDSQEVTFRSPKSGARTGLLWARRVVIAGNRRTLCFMLDISERKRMEEDLRSARLGADAAARAKSEFLANMSHEIRTPLNGILGLSQVLEEECNPDDIRPMMGLIRSSGEVLRRVLDDVLDFSKIDSGRLDLEDAPFDLRACLTWSFELFRKAAEDKDLECRLRLDESLPARVSGDTTRLRQVAANLMSNAVKFTHQGSIEMEAQLLEPAPGNGRHLIRIRVRDTGIGIPEDRIDRLFLSFSQVDASTSRCYGGTGLGLAISKRLVEMMGGQIRVESRPGEGTTFEFTVSVGTASETLPGVDLPSLEDSKGLKILVAEDNKVNQLVVVRLLTRMGCLADVAGDGQAAISRVASNAYDLVLMDLHMPGLDGLEAAKRIRRMPNAKSCVPIVALTASASQQVRTECLAAGMNDYLSKPIETEALRRAVARWGHAHRVAVPDAR